MEFQPIIDAISTVGFPIVCFCLCGWYVKYREDKNDQKVERLNELHDSETDKLTEALNNNTLALQRLADKMGGGVI